jgi:hypothetical protein
LASGEDMEMNPDLFAVRISGYKVTPLQDGLALTFAPAIGEIPFPNAMTPT